MTRTILLVEDCVQDEKLILRALKKVHILNEVMVVRDGQQALDYMFRGGEFANRNGDKLPTIVMLDINLPRVNGLNVLARLRADPRTALVPIVILTSTDEERDRLRSYENGANSFVRKPLDFTEFAEAVAHLGIYWLAVNKPPF